MTSPTPRKTALITGAAHGIGHAIALRLIHDGWSVIGIDPKPIPHPIPHLRMIQADAASEPHIAAAIASIPHHETRLDAIIANAGIMIRKPLAALTLAEWNQVIATNLTAAYILARAAQPLLTQQGGSALLIASTRAHMSEPDTEAYAASKGGLVALTHALAISLGPKIRVNCISPGWINTSDQPLTPQDHTQHPAGRVGTPADVANLAAWLLSPEATFATGAEFTLDGGMTRKMIYEE